MATPPQSAPAAKPTGGSSLIKHVMSGKSILDQEAVRERLNQFSAELQYDAEDHRQNFVMDNAVFVSGTRIDVPRFGMLADIFRRTPVIVYDLPSLKMRVNTAFVDTTGRMYLSDTFYKGLVSDSERAKGENWQHYGIYFLFMHECEHLRRLHLQRMADVPHRIANIAQDIRINIDITKTLVADILLTKGIKNTDHDYDKQFDMEQRHFLDNLSDPLKSGCAVDYAEQKKWGNMSEEQIAVQLMAENPPNPDDEDDDPQNLEISVKDLAEAVAQDLDEVGVLANRNADAAAGLLATDLAKDVRHAGAKKLKLPPADLQTLKDALCDVIVNSPHMVSRNVAHDALKIAGRPSVTIKDTYIAGLRPNDRAGMLVKIIDMVLNPSAGKGMDAKGGMRIKDLDLDGGESEAGTGDDHTMSAQELAKILEEAGLHHTKKALGYDDHIKTAADEASSKEAVISAINRGADQQIRVGSVYPGGHLVNYAKEQMHDFYQPVISWRSILKETLCAPGGATSFDSMTPWGSYYADPADFGFGTGGEMPFIGSMVPVQQERSVISVVIDTSGSVSDAMLKRFISEAVNMSRDIETQSSPEVIITFADTIIRGEPVFIDATNYEDYLKKGVSFGGRGGTDFTAATEHVLRMTESGGPLEKRKFDAIVYFTDTFDAPPDGVHLQRVAQDCQMTELPPMLFLAPIECTNAGFKKAVEDQGYGQVVFFNTKELLEIDLGELSHDARDKVTETAPAPKKKRKP